MSETIDFYIDERDCDAASFEYYLSRQVAIKSVTFKSISFYNSWWTGDFLPADVFPFSFASTKYVTDRVLTEHRPYSEERKRTCLNEKFKTLEGRGITTISEAVRLGLIDPHECDTPDDSTTTVDKPGEILSTYNFPHKYHFSLSEFCKYWEGFIRKNFKHAKLYCNESNYIILELTEDIPFSLVSIFTKENTEEDVETLVDKTITTKTTTSLTDVARVLNRWFGFKQTLFTKKGRYYSTRPLNFYRTDMFLRCNLVDKKSSLYNNSPSDILCHIPVDDGDQVKIQRYEPSNCTRSVNKSTNYLKFDITDENGIVINFRGTPVIMHFTLETIPLVDAFVLPDLA